MRLLPVWSQEQQTYPFLAKNTIAEPTKAGLIARRRPGLADFQTLATLDIRGIFWKAGIFGGDIIVVAATSLYRVSTTTTIATQISGTIAGAGRVRIDGGLDINGVETVRIATGDGLYKATLADGVTLEDFPSAADPSNGASDVVFLKGHWLASKADTDEVYILLPGETDWDALSFATAEREADVVQGLWVLGDYILIIGTDSTEVWRLTGDPDSPTEPISGLASDFGCRARDTIAGDGNLVVWVDDLCQVRMTEGGQSSVISEEWLQAKIRDAEAIHMRAWCATVRQHPLYILCLDVAGTFVYDFTTRLWSQWTSKDRDFFKGHLGTQAGATIYCADSLANSGILWKFDPDAWDDDGDEIEHLLTFYHPIEEGRFTVSSVVLSAELGTAPRSGEFADPVVGLRYSDDRGKSWSVWLEASLGARGKYTISPRWNRLGQVKSPFGRLYQVRTTDPVLSVVYGLDVNVP